MADPHERLRVALMDLFAAQRRLRGRDARIEGGISFAHFQLLSVLFEGGEMSARQLSAEAGLTPATVTEMLDALASKGVVERTRSETDRRVITNRLTPEGRERVEAKRLQLMGRWDEALAELSTEDVEAAERVIGLLTRYLESL
jgi:DNA-binding MarR family transcriptional regulator